MNSKLLQNCQALTKASLFTKFLRKVYLQRLKRLLCAHAHFLMYLYLTDLVRTKTQKRDLCLKAIFKHSIFLLELLLVRKTGTEAEGPPLLL